MMWILSYMIFCPFGHGTLMSRMYFLEDYDLAAKAQEVTITSEWYNGPNKPMCFAINVQLNKGDNVDVMRLREEEANYLGYTYEEYVSK